MRLARILEEFILQVDLCQLIESFASSKESELETKFAENCELGNYCEIFAELDRAEGQNSYESLFETALDTALANAYEEIANTLIADTLVVSDLVIGKACEAGLLSTVNLLRTLHGLRVGSLDFRKACKSGNSALVEDLLSRGCGRYANDGFLGACEGGHLELVQRMLCLSKHISQSALDFAYNKALLSGNKEVVLCVIEHGSRGTVTESMLKEFCASGSLSVVQCALEISEGSIQIVEEMILAAATSGNARLCAFLLEKYQGSVPSLAAVCSASYMSSVSLAVVDIFIGAGATDWREGIRAALRYGKNEIAKHIFAIRLPFCECPGELLSLQEIAEEGGNITVSDIDYFVQCGLCDWEAAAKEAIYSWNDTVLYYILSQHADKVNMRALLALAEGEEDTETAIEMLNHFGATPSE